MRQRLAKIFIIGAIASLFFRTGFITPASIMPFEIFIWLALIFTLPGLKLKKIAYWLKLLALFIIFSLIGLWQGYISYNNFTPEIIRGLILDYYFLISSILSFLLLIYYQEDKKFLKNCFYAFLAPLGLGILLLWPGNFFIKDFRLIAFHTGPSVLASLLIVPMAIILSELIAGEKIKNQLLAGTGATLILALIFWSGTRAAWLAIFFMLVLVFFYYLKKAKNQVKFTANLILWSIIISAIAFLIIPREAQNMMFSRIYPQYTKNFYDQKEIVAESKEISWLILAKIPSISLPGITQKNILEIIKIAKVKKDKTFVPNLSSEDRQSLFPKSLKLMASHPLGLGPQFYRIEQQILVNNFPAGAHNTFLATLLIGGPGMLLIILFLLYRAFKSWWLIKNKNSHWLGIGLSLVGLMVILIFDDRLTHPWFWIIPGLAIAWPEKSR